MNTEEQNYDINIKLQETTGFIGEKIMTVISRKQVSLRIGNM